MITKPMRTRVFEEGEDVFAFVIEHVKHLPERSVLVVTSKIVALGEKRTALVHTERQKEQLIRAESSLAVKTKYVWLTIKDGMFVASAGIDESNAKGKLILLPKDSFKAARLLRNKLSKKFGLKELGVLITDSRTIPLRAGVTGVAVGYAGFRGIRDYRGTQDIFGRTFVYSQTNVADGLAASAVLEMGEGNEQYPLALIEKAPVVFSERVNQEELRIPLKDDMYKPLFAKLPKSH